MRRTFAAPRLVLSARALDGVTRAPHERLLEIGERFREPESLAVTLTKAMDAGAEGVLAAPSPLLGAALGELERVIPLYAVLPVLKPQDEEALEPGVEPLIARARREARTGTGLRMSWTGLLRLAAFKRGDFAARMPVMLEGEAGALPDRGVTGIVLASRLTDLALAGGHRAFFESYARFVRSRFRAAAGLETGHAGLLLARLREWGAVPDFVVAPVNPHGLGMKPSPAETLAELARGGVAVVATDLRAGGRCSLEEGARFALERGARGLAPDLADMDDVAGEMKALATPAAPAD